ncbi:MAG: hypothetical protein RBS55_10695 [Bacteroidales bacterium]|jgi:hypothetical protein|nr:hypothetical protein [Bacteroidales bacterium]
MLFKESLNTNLEEIKQYLSVSQNGSFAKMRPHIAAAEILYIKDLLGEALFNRLNEWYNSEESGSTSASPSSSPPVRSVVLSGVPDQVTRNVQYSTFLVNFDDATSIFYMKNGSAHPSFSYPFDWLDETAAPGDVISAVIGTVQGQIESNYLYVSENEIGELVVSNEQIIIIDDPFAGMMLMGESKPPILEDSGSTSPSILTETSEALAQLLPLVQNALINFAYYIGADEFGLHITDAGIQIITDETHKQAFQWQVEAAKSSWLNKAYLFSDVVLLFLEQHIEDFPSWKSSDAFTERVDSLLYTTGQFNDEFFIRNSRRLFLAMKPVIRSIESKYAVPTLSQAYYDALLTALRSGNVSADDQAVLMKIRPAIAHLSMAEAITRFSVEIFPEGVYSNLVSSFGTIMGKNPSNKFDKANAIASLTADGNAEIQAIQAFLDANASAVKYPLYFSSSRYKSPSTTPNRSEFVNDAGKGILLL